MVTFNKAEAERKKERTKLFKALITESLRTILKGTAQQRDIETHAFVYRAMVTSATTIMAGAALREFNPSLEATERYVEEVEEVVLATMAREFDRIRNTLQERKNDASE